MSNTNVEVQGTSKRKFTPMAIVAIMAVLAVAVAMFAAVANGYEDNYSPVKRPVSVEKQLVEGSMADDTTEFMFEIIVSPDYINNAQNKIDKASVSGVIYGANGDYIEENNYTMTNHRIEFTLKAGQKILFENMPFAHDDEGCIFIVNELIDPSSDTAKAGYDFSKAEVPTKNAVVKVDGASVTAKAVYDAYTKYLYYDDKSEIVEGNVREDSLEPVYAYLDAKGNEVSNPNCDKNDYKYVDAYFDVNNNRIDNPNCDPNDYYDRIYFNDNTDSTTANWVFDIYQNGKWVYYDSDGNVVNDPTGDSETDRGGGYVVDGKFVAFVKQIKAYHDKDGKEITPNWVKYEHAYVNYVTEVVFTNKKVASPRPLKVTKEVEPLEENAPADSATVFNFELTISPSSTDINYAGRKVSGVITKVDSSVPPSLPTDYTFDKDHKITFSLLAGESIEFADMPFAVGDTDGTYIIKELPYASTSTDDKDAAAYELGNISADNVDNVDKGTCAVDMTVKAMGAAKGTLGAENKDLTTITVKNKQVEAPSWESPIDGKATVTIAKTLDGAVDSDTPFKFEMIISPEWANPEYYIGTNSDPVTITGTIYGKNDDREISSRTYNIVQNKVTGIELRADQYITFTDVPYKAVENTQSAIIVNELLEDGIAKSYVLQSYEISKGSDLGFDRAAADKIVNSEESVSSMLAPSGATEKTATGVYGELADDAFDVTFTNAPAGNMLTVTKSLEGFDFGKYATANVAFNVYKFDTKEACDAFIRGGSAQNATWRDTLAIRLTANGAQSAVLTGLSEGYYAVEEISATNMKVAGLNVTRKPVYIAADAGEEFSVSFDNTFDDQNTYENSIVNSYKKVYDKDGKITWQRYQNGEPVTD